MEVYTSFFCSWLMIISFIMSWMKISLTWESTLENSLKWPYCQLGCLHWADIQPYYMHRLLHWQESKYKKGIIRKWSETFVMQNSIFPPHHITANTLSLLRSKAHRKAKQDGYVPKLVQQIQILTQKSPPPQTPPPCIDFIVVVVVVIDIDRSSCIYQSGGGGGGVGKYEQDYLFPELWHWKWYK